MDVGLGIERRRYVEGENCGDETYCGCEEMHHVHLLLGLIDRICLYMESVLADVGFMQRASSWTKRIGNH